MHSSEFKKGVITGLDSNNEWFLKWWWERYSKHNDYPVIFFDFGMSEEARNFCKEKGTLVDIENIELKPLTEEEKKIWYKVYPEIKIQFSRSAWKKKGLALCKTPFDITLWLDLDCCIVKNLEPLFNELGNEDNICMSTECEAGIFLDHIFGLTYYDEVVYNSGVIVYRKDIPLLKDFLDLFYNSSFDFVGDQNALSRAIYNSKYPVKELSDKYNKIIIESWEDPEVFIFHFAGISGKKKLKEWLDNEICLNI